MTKKASLILFGSFLVLAFQNCSPVHFASIVASGEAFKSSNNGTGYSGKPDGDFYRFNPDFNCENKEAPVSEVHIIGSTVNYVENKKLQCGAVKQSLDPNLIDSSVFQNEIIGYQEGIFESENSVPTSIPANLVEVWCKDTNDRSGIEVILHYDRSTQLAVSRIYSAGPDPDVLVTPDFNVSRVVTPTLVTAKDGKDFSLKVYRDQPAAQVGLFKGSLEAMVNGRKVTRETSCRLGGSLDAKVWPARQIVDLSILIFKFQPDYQLFGFTSLAGDTIDSLYRGDLQGQQLVKDSTTHSTFSSLNFDFLPDMLSIWTIPLRTTPTPPDAFIWTVPTVICPQVLAASSNFLDLGSDQWLVTSWDETTGTLGLYLQNNGQCQLKNSIPLSKPVVNGLYIAPDTKKTVVSVTINIQGTSHDELFFVPLDGKPPLQINSPVYIGATVGNVHILPDSQSVFYTGDQLRSGDIGAFLWKAP